MRNCPGRGYSWKIWSSPQQAPVSLKSHQYGCHRDDLTSAIFFCKECIVGHHHVCGSNGEEQKPTEKKTKPRCNCMSGVRACSPAFSKAGGLQSPQVLQGAPRCTWCSVGTHLGLDATFLFQLGWNATRSLFVCRGKNGVTSLFLNGICRASSITWLLILLLALLSCYLQDSRCPQVPGARFALHPALPCRGKADRRGEARLLRRGCGAEKAAKGSSQPNKPPRRPAAALSLEWHQRPYCHTPLF